MRFAHRTFEIFGPVSASMSIADPAFDSVRSFFYSTLSEPFLEVIYEYSFYWRTSVYRRWTCY